MLKEKSKGKLKNGPTSPPLDPHLVPSIIDDFRWMLDDFDDGLSRYVTISKDLFNQDHPDITIGKNEIEICLNKKELEMCHISIYMRLVSKNIIEFLFYSIFFNS